MLTNFILPPWAKYVAAAFFAMVVWGHGYTTGLERAYKAEAREIVKVVYKQGKVTTKVVTKYVKQAEKLEEHGEKVKHEGNSYAIKFADDDYIFNNYFVRLYDASLQDSFPSLSGGADADPSGVGVSEVLETSINNNTAGKLWELRARSCEEWAAKQEGLNE